MFLRIFLILACLLFVSAVYSQNKQQEKIINDTLRIPPVGIGIKGIGEHGLIRAPEQIGFGTLLIDTVPDMNNPKYYLPDSVYRSTKLLVKLFEKDFIKWAKKTYEEEDAKKKAIEAINPFPLDYMTPMKTGIHLSSLFKFWNKKDFGYKTPEENLNFFLGESKRILEIDRERRRKKKEREEEEKKKNEAKIEEDTSFTIPLQAMVKIGYY